MLLLLILYSLHFIHTPHLLQDMVSKLHPNLSYFCWYSTPTLTKRLYNHPLTPLSTYWLWFLAPSDLQEYTRPLWPRMSCGQTKRAPIINTSSTWLDAHDLKLSGMVASTLEIYGMQPHGSMMTFHWQEDTASPSNHHLLVGRKI